MRYYEDFTVGECWEFAGVTLTEEEIVAFAERYDPQSFHTDPDEATGSVYGGLVASGWHTIAVTMRTLVEQFLADTATQGSIGVDELRWKAPVRPADTLSITLEIMDKEPYRRSLGLVRGRVLVVNQDGNEVLSLVGLLLFERQNEPPSDQSSERPSDSSSEPSSDSSSEPSPESSPEE